MCGAVVCDLGDRGMDSVQGLSVSTSIVGSRVPVFLQAPCGPDPFLCSLLCSPFFLHRAQVHPLGLQFLSCAFPTFVLTGSYVDMLCWSQRPMKPSR